jgi:hypothetical protein
MPAEAAAAASFYLANQWADRLSSSVFLWISTFGFRASNNTYKYYLIANPIPV